MRTVILVILFAGFFLALPGSAQDEAAPPAGPPAETTAPAETTPDAGSGADAEALDDEEEDDFEFSEEVPADEELVFPVDI